MRFRLSLCLGVLCLCVAEDRLLAGVLRVNSPADMPITTTIGFDGYASDTVANGLYAAQGITFTRDDGAAIPLWDCTSDGRATTSPPNVLATLMVPNKSWVSHLNVVSASPLLGIGAYFGNDQADPRFSSMRLSAFDLSGHLLGSVQVAVNNNTSVDQFIGLRSDVPFSRARFENLDNAQVPSTWFAVVIDDLVVAAVPEPAALWVFAVAMTCLLRRIRRIAP